MTREEIIEKLADSLGEEQAAAIATALIGEAVPTQEPESAPENAESEPETPEAEAEASESDAEAPEAEPEQTTPEPEQTVPEPEQTAPEAEASEPEAEALESEPDPAETLRAENDTLRDRLKGMMMRLAATSLGVAPERVDVVRRLAVFGDGELTEETALAAVRRVLEEVPELAGRAVPVTGSIGTHPREAPRTVDPFEKGFFR